MSQQYIPIVLGVGETRTLQTSGKVFVCDSSTGDFAIRFDNSAEITGSSKRAFGSSTSPTFNRVTVRNTSGVTNTVVYAISLSDIKIEQQIASVIATITVAASTNASTYTKGSGVQTLTSGANISYTGLDGSAARRQIVVRNRSTSAGVLNIRDASGNIMDTLAAGDPPWTLETNGTINLHASGGDCDYTIASTFYT